MPFTHRRRCRPTRGRRTETPRRAAAKVLPAFFALTVSTFVLFSTNPRRCPDCGGTRQRFGRHPTRADAPRASRDETCGRLRRLVNVYHRAGGRSLRWLEPSPRAHRSSHRGCAEPARPLSRLLDTFGDRYSKAILAVILLRWWWVRSRSHPLMGRGSAMYRQPRVSHRRRAPKGCATRVRSSAVERVRDARLVRGGVARATPSPSAATGVRQGPASITTGVLLVRGWRAGGAARSPRSWVRRTPTRTPRELVESNCRPIDREPRASPTRTPRRWPSRRASRKSAAASPRRARRGRGGVRVGVWCLPARRCQRFQGGAQVRWRVSCDRAWVARGPPRLARFGAWSGRARSRGTPRRADALRRAAAVASDRGGDVAAALVVEDVDVPFPSSDEFCDVEAYDPEAWRSENLAASSGLRIRRIQRRRLPCPRFARARGAAARACVS